MQAWAAMKMTIRWKVDLYFKTELKTENLEEGGNGMVWSSANGTVEDSDRG